MAEFGSMTPPVAKQDEETRMWSLWNEPETAVAAEDHTLFLPLLYKPHETYYVSKNGNNSNGLSWATAWNELDQIDWSVIMPGDTILLDGGSSQMVYNTTLTIDGVAGTSEEPVHIRLGAENGRNGQVIIFGGRSLPLPYCGEIGYTFQENGVNDYGILLNDTHHVVIDGTKRNGISMYGHNNNGIRFNSNTDHITLKYLEIYDNGYAEDIGGDQWEPNGAGIRIAGSNHLLERLIIQDNGQDAIQSGAGFSPNFNTNNLDDLTIRQSWLHNARKHPTVNESANYCAHTDGLQINRGGDVRNITFEEMIIGPGLTNGVILGQTLTGNGAEASVHNVTFRNVLFTKAAENSIRGYTSTNPTGWVVENVTSHCPETKGHCIYLEGDNHAVTGSIFVDAAVTFPDGLDTASGNCQWNTSNDVIGIVADPQFVGVNSNDMFSLDNYSLSSSSPCSGSGSGLTSVNQLLSILDNP